MEQSSEQSAHHLADRWTRQSCLQPACPLRRSRGRQLRPRPGSGARNASAVIWSGWDKTGLAFTGPRLRSSCWGRERRATREGAGHGKNNMVCWHGGTRSKHRGRDRGREEAAPVMTTPPSCVARASTSVPGCLHGDESSYSATPCRRHGASGNSRNATELWSTVGCRCAATTVSQ
jgi:hypothetical protein